MTVLPPRDDEGLITTRAAPQVEDFRERAPEIAASIQEIAGTIQDQLRTSSAPADGWGMDSVKLSFELALEAGAGVVIAKTSATATFSIEITWKRPPVPA